jgi:acyl-CoA oxidase
MYTGMMAARMTILNYSWCLPSRAVLIAMRYSHFRKQFKNDEGIERTLIDYQLQQFKMFTALANIWAIYMASEAISRLYQEHLESMKNDDFSKLTELHMAMSDCKAMCTFWASSTLETCRMSCGGYLLSFFFWFNSIRAGFHEYSGIPGMIRNMLPNMTLEGDNTVMLLQTSRILVSSLQKAASGKSIPSSASYISKEPVEMSKVLGKKEGYFVMKNIIDLSGSQLLLLLSGQQNKSFLEEWRLIMEA